MKTASDLARFLGITGLELRVYKDGTEWGASLTRHLPSGASDTWNGQAATVREAVARAIVWYRQSARRSNLPMGEEEE